jgi:hypothetical protein
MQPFDLIRPQQLSQARELVIEQPETPSEPAASICSTA